MDSKTRIIILGGVALLIVASVLGVFIYLSRSSKTSNSLTPSTTDPLSRLRTTSTTPSPLVPRISEIPSNTNTNTKVFTGDGFSLNYPNSWGILTCGNSKNFEFDPTNSGDINGVMCGDALKPVTVLVADGINCPGQPVRMGDAQVIKSQANLSVGGTSYEWCVTVAGKGLDITHRVSPSGSRATSKEDYSAQVEQMIETIKIASGGS